MLQALDPLRHQIAASAVAHRFRFDCRAGGSLSDDSVSSIDESHLPDEPDRARLFASSFQEPVLARPGCPGIPLNAPDEP